MNYLETYTQNRIGYIVLNRPEKRNAFNQQLVSELDRAFDQMESDSEVRVVVLKARGDVFCAGADLEYLQQLQNFSYDENLQDSRYLASVYQKIYELEKPVIAQVQGHAIAGGAGLATVCDFCFSVPGASFGYTEVKIGFVPAIVSFFLSKKIGEGRARSLLLQGNLISAEQALSLGIVQEICAADVLEDRVEKFALELISTTSGESLKLTKKLISEISSAESTHAAMDIGAQYNAQSRATIDCKKGIAAFLNKEKINW